MKSNSSCPLLAGVSRVILFMFVLATAWSLPTVYGIAADPVDPPDMFSGILRDDAGNPLAGAKITARNVGGLYCGNIKVRSDETTTDENGRFSLHTGFYPVHLSVESEAGTMGYPQNPYYFGRPIPLPLLRKPEHNVVLMRWATVKGNIVDQKTGGPVSEFRVHYHAYTTHAPRSYQSKDGRFAEERVNPGTQTISVMADGYAPMIFHAVPVSPGSVIDIGTVQMGRGPTLTGRILSANNGRPMVGAVIRFGGIRTLAVVNYPPDDLMATTDDDGRFSVQNMPLLILKMYTSIEKPEHRSLTIGSVDMSLAQNGALEVILFVNTEDEHLPHEQ